MRRSLTLLGAALTLVAIGVFGAGAGIGVAQDSTPCAETTSDQNKAFILEWNTEVFQNGNEAYARDTMADDYRHVWGIGNETTGLEPFFERLDLFHTAFPDMTITVDHVLAEDDLVALAWTVTATHEGDWLGIPPTGTEATWSGKNVFQIECGKLVMSSSTSDHLSLLTQLGAAPAAATPAP